MLSFSWSGSRLPKTPHFCGRWLGPRYTTLDCKEESYPFGTKSVQLHRTIAIAIADEK